MENFVVLTFNFLDLTNMFSLIPISLLITAIGGIVYIASNHLSEFSDGDGDNGAIGDNSQFKLKARLAQWTKELPLDNIKSQSLSLTQKMLHKFRLTLLKADNHLMKLIGKISEKDKQINGSGNSNGNNSGNDFWENLSKSKEENLVIKPIANETTKIEFAKEMDIKKPVRVSGEVDIKLNKKPLKTKKSGK